MIGILAYGLIPAAFLASLVGLFTDRGSRGYAIAGLALSVVPILYLLMMCFASVAVRLCG